MRGLAPVRAKINALLDEGVILYSPLLASAADFPPYSFVRDGDGPDWGCGRRPNPRDIGASITTLLINDTTLFVAGRFLNITGVDALNIASYDMRKFYASGGLDLGDASDWPYLAAGCTQEAPSRLS